MRTRVRAVRPMTLAFNPRAFLVLVPALLQGCVVETVSLRSGGHGIVLSRGEPVVGAGVSVVDIGGTQTGTTDARGEFRIAAQSRRGLIFLMENPMFHEVTLHIDAPGFPSAVRTIRRKSVFGSADLDFGRIELSERLGSDERADARTGL